jgi:cellulose synthase/poly-beta-1,6-N-acetylglucosamine synthase-like glycosyltransferase
MTLQEHPFLLALLVTFGITFLVQSFYYLYFFLTPLLFRHPEPSGKKQPVSVIICARNEEENLKEFLPAVLEQDYPDYEVVLVNDCSDDESFEVLGEYLKKYPHLRVTNILKDPKFTHNKKFAQFIGIKAAANEILVFTDADCRPESGKWLENMVSGFGENIDFVLGYGGYFARKGLLNKYIRYDCLTIAMQYLGMAIRGLPYMGVGRNLSYRRSLFFEKKGFGIHTNLASGDDDLFVNSNAKRDNVTVEFRKDAHTRSVPAESSIEFYRQKRRHLTTANYYKLIDKLILILEPVSRILFYTTFIILLTNLYAWPLVLGIFLLRLIIQYTILILTAKKFNEPGIFPFILIFDVLSPLINAVIYTGSQIRGSSNNKWN